MWGFTTVVGALALAFVVGSLAWAGPGVLIAVPIALAAVGIAGLMDLRRRRNQATSLHEHRERARTDKVDFTERDEQTLVSD
jgi:Flp pilus assembly protein TadB